MLKYRKRSPPRKATSPKVPAFTGAMPQLTGPPFHGPARTYHHRGLWNLRHITWACIRAFFTPPGNIRAASPST